MKKCIWICLLMAVSLHSFAQNTWEVTEKTPAKEQVAETQNPQAPYLKGAVPEIDGKVSFRTTLDAPGKSAFELYNIMGKYLQGLTRQDDQINSQLIKADTTTFEIATKMEEWLVFKSTSLALDRTEMKYTIHAVCSTGKVDIELSNIRYTYDEGHTIMKVTAEEWITDKYAVNKKNTKLYPISGKFRRKTIDRKNDLFKQMEELLK